MQIYVYSRSAIEAIPAHEVPHVLVSITSAADDVARLRRNELTRGVLRVSFVDAEEASATYSEAQLFSEAQAKQIWSFVGEHRDRIERIVIHCDAGVSRSAAVAAALARGLRGEGEDAEFFGGRYRPNARVYRLMNEGKPP